MSFAECWADELKFTLWENPRNHRTGERHPYGRYPVGNCFRSGWVTRLERVKIGARYPARPYRPRQWERGACVAGEEKQPFGGRPGELAEDEAPATAIATFFGDTEEGGRDGGVVAERSAGRALAPKKEDGESPYHEADKGFLIYDACSHRGASRRP